MKTLSRFVLKFTKFIVATLSCFSRIMFKGYLPITDGSDLDGYIDNVLKNRRIDFL